MKEPITKELRHVLVGLPRVWKRAVMVGTDAGGAVAALVLAALLQGLPIATLFVGFWPVPLVMATVVTACSAMGLYRAIIRYIALKAALRIGAVSVIVVLALSALAPFVSSPLFQFGVLANFGLLLMLGLGAARILARHFLVRFSDADAERLLIYGAGNAGVQAANSLGVDARRRVVGFIDNSGELVGKEVADLPVFGAGDLERVVKRKRVASVLLAMPSASRRRKQEIVARIEPLHVTVKTVPALEEILAGRAQVSDIRDIEVEDLLGRDPVPPDQALLGKAITGQVVMVTGAGGSIGGELCRQIVAMAPSRLLLFETSEYSLYQVDRQMRKLAADLPDTAITPVLGNVLDRKLVDTCIRRYGVQTLYHAAAYKHVPLVEQNASAGLRNNVFGTYNVAESALLHGVERFILVSTDKAVRPTNVMGATKRVAERVVQAMAERAARMNGSTAHCIFSMVRFGNVLDSSGSVVPQFRQQIRDGGPVTVTHPHITRYFMTIPEASQLVIQAGAMASGGEVFVLDMGEPVRITDLAQRMIRLAGCTVRDDDHSDGDIAIEYTGLRPGEKLFEELLIDDADHDTVHPKIARAQEKPLSWRHLEPLLVQMQEAMGAYRRGKLKTLLNQAVPEYQPSRDMLGRVDEPADLRPVETTRHDEDGHGVRVTG